MAIAHCRAYRLIHEIAPGSQVGLAHHVRAFVPFAPGNPAHRLAARFDAHLFQDVLTDAALGGRFARVIGGQPPGIAPGRYYDYVGINYYTRSAVSGIGDGRQRVKESGHFVREIIANRGVTEEMHARYVEPQRYRIA